MLPIQIVLIFLSCYEIDRFYEKVFLTAQTEIKKRDDFADFDVKFEIFDAFFNKTNDYPNMRNFNKKYHHVMGQIVSFPFQFVQFGYCNETHKLEYGTNNTEQIVSFGRRQLNGEAVVLNRQNVILNGVDVSVQRLFEVVKAMLQSNVSMCENKQ
jgi:hypothetical protein